MVLSIVCRSQSVPWRRVREKGLAPLARDSGHIYHGRLEPDRDGPHKTSGDEDFVM